MIIKNYQLNFFVYCIYVCGVINSIFWTLITLKRLCLCDDVSCSCRKSMVIDYKKHDLCKLVTTNIMMSGMDTSLNTVQKFD